MIVYRTSLSLILFSLFAIRPGIVEAEPVSGQGATSQQQDQARHNQLAPQSKTLLTAENVQDSDTLILPKESVCYDMKHVVIDKTVALPHWLTFNDLIRQVEKHCIGIQGITALHKAVQNRLISHGYITSRVLVPDQNLKEGTLTLRILPGRISEWLLQNQEGRTVHSWNNFPEAEGDVLDLRGLEQGLENLQRIPGSQASIHLVPGEHPGDTRVEVSRSQNKAWRLGTWMDDAGSKKTGRYEGGLAFYLNNPTTLNDIFYVAYGGGFKNEYGRRNDNTSAFYSVPWGYWLLELYGSKYRTVQTIHSGDYHYQYSSSEKLLTAEIKRVIYRSASQKTTLGFKGIKRDSHYELNDVEVEVQRRDTSSWQLNLEHLAYLPFGQLTSRLGYQHAAHWFGEQADAEEMVGSADPLARIITLSVDGTFPFKAGDLSMSYEPHFMQQTSPDKLTQPDKFTIGNRWTVRGFDGESSIYADKGWYLRNDINLNLPRWGMQPYLGFDYGEVSGSKNDYWSGTRIAGAVAGVRGVKGNVGYDLFAGVPVMKPDDMQTSPFTLGFSVQWQY